MRVFTVVLFLGLASCCLAELSKTTNFIKQLEQCEDNARVVIRCITTVKDSLQKLSNFIKKVHNLKIKMQKIKDGLKTLDTVLKLARYVPPISGVVSSLKRAIDTIKKPLDKALEKVKAIDARLYPLKPRIDKGIRLSKKAITKLQQVKDKCHQGRAVLTRARNCVRQMDEGKLRSHLEDSLETFSGSVAPQFSRLVKALGKVASTCSSIKLAIDIPLPDLGSIIRGIDGLFNALKPILDFFSKLQVALDYQFCMPDPLEPGRELAERTREGTERTREAAVKAAAIAKERTREAAVRAARAVRERAREARVRAARFARERAREIRERAEEAREVPRKIFGGWGKRKKRELKVITKEEANHLLIRRKRSKQICFSIQQLLDGVSKLFDPLLKLAQKAIDALLSAVPSFNLPGLPNFDILDRLLNLNIKIPDINFGIDFFLLDLTLNVNFECIAQVFDVCKAGFGTVECKLHVGK